MRPRVAEGFPDKVTPELAAFIAEQDTAFLATANARRRALHPASRRAEGLHQGHR